MVIHVNSSPRNPSTVRRTSIVRTVTIVAAVLATVGLTGTGSAAPPAGRAIQAQPGPGVATVLACGDTITMGVTLTADLTCPGTILTIGANNLVIDLNGFTITGVGVDAEIRGFSRSGVVIRNGSIRSTRLMLYGNAAGAIDSVAFSDGFVYVGPSNDFRVTSSAFRATALQVSGAPRLVVTRSSFVGGRLSIAGIGASRADNASVSETSFIDAPVSFASDANRPSITASTFLRSPVDLSQSDQLDVRDSTFHGAGIRLTSSSRNAVVADSTFSGAPIAVEITSLSVGARIERNAFQGNGIGVLATAPRMDMLAGTAVALNRFDGNATAGVLIKAASNGNAHQWLMVTGNRLSLNGLSPDGRTGSTGQLVNDGVHLDVPAAAAVTVAGNTTLANGDHGIQVAPGTVSDGGGNSSTGDPAGCSGVVCS